PLGIVVCALPKDAYEGKTEYAVIDASCAAENLLLAADALGLGAVWTALYPQPAREASARRLLGIPEDVIPLAFIPIGRPRGEILPKEKFKEAKVHRGRW
ncbi:MAG: nitroreductase family protein, partial [Spirochaetota bacterium]